MLPGWVSDLGTLVGLATGIPAIVGLLFSLMGRSPRPPTAPDHRPAVPDHPTSAPVTFGGAFREGLAHLLINPDKPLWDEILFVIIITGVLVFVSVIWVWNMLLPIQLAWDRPLQTLATA